MKNRPMCGRRSAWLGGSLVLALSLFSCTETKTKNVPTPTPVPTTPVVNEEARDYGQYTEKVWSDEFEGGALDQSIWNYEKGGGGWGNNELENYTDSPENVYVSGGTLVIRALRQQMGANAFTSGRLLTKGKKSFLYGRIDVRAKIPKGKGIWPAIWMMGTDIDQNNWPRCGEIDIMEVRGSRPRELLTTMHFGNSSADHRMKGITQNLTYDLSEDFHVYTVIRSKDLLRFFLDGQPYYSLSGSDVSPNPFNNPFFVLLNVAVGGDFDGNPDGSTMFPQQMQVDYVRHYQYK